MTLLWMLACAGPDPVDSAVEDSGEPAPERFVSLAARPMDSLLLDVRSPEEFEAAHIPGAVNVPWGDVRATQDGISGQLADPEQVSAAFAAVGLAPEQDLVLYDGRSSRDAGRLAWSLEVSGHRGALQILDGGWLQWTEQERPTASGPVSTSSSDWQASPPDPALIDADWILARLDAPGFQVLDVRTPEEFAAGHIPGAINIPWDQATVQEGPEIGTLLPEAELLTLYAALPMDGTIVVSCQSGARAGHSWAVLPTLGFQDVRLYDGSWAAWSSRDDLPVAY